MTDLILTPMQRLIEQWRRRGRQLGEPFRLVAELADLLDVSRHYLYMLARGQRGASIPVRERLARVLQTRRDVIDTAIAATCRQWHEANRPKKRRGPKGAHGPKVMHPADPKLKAPRGTSS